jgi:hypothetical protein
MPELIFATVVKGRTPELKKVVRQHAPHADRSIVILHTPYQESEDFLASQECKDLNISWSVINVPYHPPTLRNAYLSQLPPGAWAFHMDCDEFMEDPGCYQLRHLVNQAEQSGINRIGFQAHDIRVGLNGEVYDNLANYWNPVLFKVYPGICWAGELHGGLHTPNVAPNFANVKYRYFHIKTTASEILRGCHNYYYSGQTAQNNTDVPEWKEFKTLCVKHGLKYFPDMYEYLKRGNIHEDFKQWMVLNRNNENGEARSWFTLYFGLLHPGENTYLAGNKEIQYDKNRKPYAGEMTF